MGDEKTKYGWTPLEIAALNGRSDIVKELIEIYGADPNHASGRYSPLEYAIECGHLETVQQMVTLGAKEKERMKKDIFRIRYRMRPPRNCSADGYFRSQREGEDEEGHL